MQKCNHARMTDRLRFDELALFVEVTEAGSIAAAARRLGVPKSTVGRALTRLERDLGAVLVRRMGAGPALTEAGRNLIAHAGPHVAALRDVASALTREVDEVHGTIRVTAPVDVSQLVLAPLIASFVVRHPRVSVEVDASIRMVDLVREGFDFAIRVAQKALAPSSLVAKKLARLDLGLYASPAYLARQGTPKRAFDLSAHEFVLLFSRNGRMALPLEGPRGSERVEVRGRVSANDFYFMAEAAAAGAGIAPLPWLSARPEVAAGRLVRVLPDRQFAGNTAYLLHAPLKPLPRKVEAFRAHLLEHAPRLLSNA